MSRVGVNDDDDGGGDRDYDDDDGRMRYLSILQ